MNIGEAAEASGLSAKMIRHYEAIDLLQPQRRGNNYRDFSAHDVAELSFIRHARDLAFPLEDVRRLLALWRDRGRASAEVRRIALDHVAALADRYAMVGKALREGIDATDEAGDADTADLLTGLSRAADKMLWMLEAHLPHDRHE